MSEACPKKFTFCFNLLATISSEHNLKMSTPPSQGDAKAGKPDQLPPIKRDFSRKFYTMTPEDILNNRVGPNVSRYIYMYSIASMMKGDIILSLYDF